MVAFYNQEDQDIYKTNQFMPQSRFLLNAPKPVVEEEEVTESFGIPQTQAFNNSGGNDFSVYNPDPNSIVNRNYRPNYDFRQFSEYGSDPSTADIKQMDMNQNYFNKPPVDPKMKGLMSMIPYAGSLMRGANFLGNQIGPYMPTNRRAIMENELGGKGVMVNNIGQIVQGEGDYNTAQNVMAGYNANKINQETINKRQGTIEKTLVDKYEMSPTDIAAVKAGTYKGPVETDLIGRYGALGEYGNINNLTNKKVDEMEEFEDEQKKKLRDKTILGKIFGKKKQKKEDARVAKEKADAAAAAATMQRNTFVSPSGVTGGDNQYDYAGRSNQYGTHDATKTKEEAATNRESYRGKDGGRVKYFFGGRVNFKDGGLVSIL